MVLLTFYKDHSELGNFRAQEWDVVTELPRGPLQVNGGCGVNPPRGAVWLTENACVAFRDPAGMFCGASASASASASVPALCSPSPGRAPCRVVFIAAVLTDE